MSEKVKVRDLILCATEKILKGIGFEKAQFFDVMIHRKEPHDGGTR
jgi:hypothetical protein